MSKINEDIRAAHECESRLRSFYWLLGNAHTELKVWHSIWIGRRAFQNETYVHFWGVQGFAEVQSRIDGITELSYEIKGLLYQPAIDETGTSLLLRSELKDWHHLIDHDLAKLPSWRPAEHPKLGLMRKIGFALFRNATLQDKIDRLKSHIEGLRDFTQHTFRLRQHTDPNKKVTISELRLISDLKAFVDRISDFGNLLYASRLPSRRLEWAVELGPPDVGYSLDLWSEVDAMYIDFVVRVTDRDVQTMASRVRFFVENELAHRNGDLPFIAQRVDEVVLGHEQPDHASEYDRSFSLLERPRKRSRPLRKMLTEGLFSGECRKNFDVERADLICGLGHWMVLLWNTPWSCDICTCGIRCTYITNTCTRHSFFSYPQRSHWHPECHSSKLAENRFELLGVALAEIALGLPISVILQQKDTSYRVGEELLSRKRLLAMLRERFGRNTITKAVSYCLDPDSADLGCSLRPDHFEKYCQNIVLPLQTYHKTIKKHFSSAIGERFRKDMDLPRYYEAEHGDVSDDGDLVSQDEHGDGDLSN